MEIVIASPIPPAQQVGTGFGDHDRYVCFFGCAENSEAMVVWFQRQSSWGPFGATFGSLVAFRAGLGRLGAISGQSWVLWGGLGRLGGVLERPWGRLGGVLGCLGGVLGRLGDVLGRLGGVLRRLGGVLAQFGPILGPSWVDLGSQNGPKIDPEA